MITSGLLSGLAGAYLAIGVSNTFVPNMTDGRGYIALAAMIFGKWTPRGAFVACLIFGLGQAIYDNNSIIHVSQYLLSMLPTASPTRRAANELPIDRPARHRHEGHHQGLAGCSR